MTKFLDPLDSSFILLETPGTSMNIGAIIELEAAKKENPEKRFAHLRDHVASRLHEIPVLRQRVVRAPFDMTWPILVPDEKFDIDRHVIRVVLPSPGSAAQFDAFVSEFLSRPLSPQRPLWQLLVIEGRDDGRPALVMKAHHALADGVSFAETFANFFDIAPEVRPPAPPIEEDLDVTVTTSLGLLREGVSRVIDRPSLVVESLASWTRRLYEVLRGFSKVVAVRGRPHAAHDQPSIFDARRSSLNGAAGIEKTYLRTQVALAEAKRAAKARGVTVTDFVMATMSGALRRLIAERGEELKKDLIAFVPINVRGEGDTAEMGNQISGMLVALHTELDDPEERLLAISVDAAKTVGEQRVRRAKIFQDLPRVLGPTLVSLGGRVAAAFSLFDHVPMANLLVSSVPGPPVPLWLCGRRVESAAPFGPLVASFSLNVTVLGFGDRLEFGLLGCADHMADLATLRDFVFEEATALIAATPAS